MAIVPAIASSRLGWPGRSCRRSASCCSASGRRPASWSDCRSWPRRESARWRGAGGCWPRCPGATAVGAGRRQQPERAVADLRDAGRGLQEALRPGRGVGADRDRCGTACSSCRVASTRASTSRGGSPGGATRSSARSARSTPRRREQELTELKRSIGRKQPTPSQSQTAQALEAQLASAQPARGAGRPQPRPAAPARRPLRRAGRPHRRGQRRQRRHRCASATTSTGSSTSWRACASPWRRPTGRRSGQVASLPEPEPPTATA